MEEKILAHFSPSYRLWKNLKEQFIRVHKLIWQTLWNL